jgi:hypothetical protein
MEHFDSCRKNRIQGGGADRAVVSDVAPDFIRERLKLLPVNTVRLDG